MKRIVLVAALCSALSSVLAPVTVAHAKPQTHLTRIADDKNNLLKVFVMPYNEFKARYKKMTSRFKEYNFNCRHRTSRLGIASYETGYIQCNPTKK
ncbi:hypothetical protein X471_01144 [Bartonella bacilliformis str. Heidi Mejia]|uniref:hypothetical protein n=1 Tax=Bartonella bacilliformis TaxID=774 RepID=UPI00044714A3|nr:hypothetical protein [Bartonella bacilliformis]EYS91009.1 hypothetical protein X471_01144 [Bartonella bacilliformis str. Heidi Mejia]KEG21798.1 hypothetical protein H708_01051 [Bartonella bacilliformis VAB9028]KEG23173.1 hypothetical protein H706_01061 [Bartonella bacilliformis CAR600-02]